MYVKIIHDINDELGTSVRSVCVCGEAEDFMEKISFYRRSTLSPYLFLLVVDELMKEVQDEFPWCVLFADAVVYTDN